eukprot:CAMPEP_0172878132 /NCGR_PEP_ID=MMETSP1075-20121228/108781_1 /TAXON_ID=2916 /ORGANISM="Ceratium fusus, Strain PA161109" /LENGTH=127 /DNA_ID=CAMNT_0013729845 /DNA_START=281 /DNA_END=665 /DNA_ORIENTATION=-
MAVKAELVKLEMRDGLPHFASRSCWGNLKFHPQRTVWCQVIVLKHLNNLTLQPFGVEDPVYFRYMKQRHAFSYDPNFHANTDTLLGASAPSCARVATREMRNLCWAIKAAPTAIAAEDHLSGHEGLD